jgi:hypothetical protein
VIEASAPDTASKVPAFDLQIGATAAGDCLAVVEQLHALHPAKNPRGRAWQSNGGNNDAVGRHVSKAQPRLGLRPTKLPSGAGRYVVGADTHELFSLLLLLFFFFS